MLKKLLLTTAVLIGSISLTACGTDNKEVAASGSVAIKEGVHYQVLEKTFEAPKNQVLEFFWYGCPHCYTAEKVVKPWSEKNQDKYTLVKMHSHLNNSWMFDAYVFYGLKSLGLENSVGDEYFAKRQGDGFKNDDHFYSWLESKGVTKSALDEASASKDSMSLRDKMVLIERGIDAGGVPAFVVAGKYKVLLGGLGDFGGWPGITTVFEKLIEKAENEY